MRLTATRRRIAAACTGLVALVSAQTATAACWDPASIGAARVREFQLLLEGVQLRCNAIGFDIHEGYYHFLDTQHAMLAERETRLKNHFNASGNPKTSPGMAQFDRYLIKIANIYGVGQTDAKTCQMFDKIDRELSAPNVDPDQIEAYAMVLVRDPHLDSDRCTALEIAQAEGSRRNATRTAK